MKVEGAGSPPPPGGGGDPAGDGLTVAAKAKRSALVRKGLKLQVACAAACKVSAKLARKGKTVGKGARTLVAPGTAKVTVKLSKAGRRSVKAGGSLTLAVQVMDAGGTRTLNRTVKVK